MNHNSIIAAFFVSILFLMTPKDLMTQESKLTPLLYLDEVLSDFEILKVDTEFYNSGVINKLFYYDINSTLRKTKTYFKTGELSSISNWNDKKDKSGISLGLYQNGMLEYFGLFNSGVGFSFGYYIDGKIKYQSQTKDNKYIGYYASYCSEGQLYEELFYDSLYYTQKGYHCNGKIRFEGDIINNSTKTSTWKYYSEQGKLIKEEEWNMGKLISTKEY